MAMSFEQFCKGIDRLHAEMVHNKQPNYWDSPPPPPSHVSMDMPVEVNSVCYMCKRPLVADKPIKFQFCTDCEMKMICTNTAKQQQEKVDQNLVDEFGGCTIA